MAHNYQRRRTKFCKTVYRKGRCTLKRRFSTVQQRIIQFRSRSKERHYGRRCCSSYGNFRRAYKRKHFSPIKKGLLSYSMWTTCDSDNLHHLCERFTTCGVPCASLLFCSFATRYYINYVKHTNASLIASTERRMLHQY